MGLLLPIVLLGFSALPQTLEQQEPPVFRAGVALVRIDAQVVDGNRVLGKLTKDDFRVLDEGQPVSIEHFGRESEPVRLVLLLDVSGSMHKYLQQMAATGRTALNQLAPGDRVAVMVFGRNSRIREEFTEDYTEVAREIGVAAAHDASVGSGTAINSAVIDAAGYIGKQPREGRRAILIVTDNLSLNYRTPDEAVIRALYSADAVLNAIVVGNGYRPEAPKPGRYVNPDFTPSDVFKLAEETGGDALRSDQSGPAFREMIERIRTRYSIHYRAPEAAPGMFRRMHVELSSAARKKYPNAKVKARNGYFAAGSGS